jgi:hypothetical protein
LDSIKITTVSLSISVSNDKGSTATLLHVKQIQSQGNTPTDCDYCVAKGQSIAKTLVSRELGHFASTGKQFDFIPTIYYTIFKDNSPRYQNRQNLYDFLCRNQNCPIHHILKMMICSSEKFLIFGLGFLKKLVHLELI